MQSNKIAANSSMVMSIVEWEQRWQKVDQPLDTTQLAAEWHVSCCTHKSRSHGGRVKQQSMIQSCPPLFLSDLMPRQNSRCASWIILLTAMMFGFSVKAAARKTSTMNVRSEADKLVVPSASILISKSSTVIIWLCRVDDTGDCYQLPSAIRCRMSFSMSWSVWWRYPSL